MLDRRDAWWAACVLQREEGGGKPSFVPLGPAQQCVLVLDLEPFQSGIRNVGFWPAAPLDLAVEAPVDGALVAAVAFTDDSLREPIVYELWGKERVSLEPGATLHIATR